MLAVVLVLLGLVIARTAHAEDDGHRVLLTMAGDPAESRALALVVRDLLDRLDMHLETASEDAIDPKTIVSRPEGFEPIFARAWVDMSADDHALLYIADQAWERVLIRRVRRTVGHIEVSREELGHIIETAIEALLEGGRIGVARSTLQPTQPPPKPIVEHPTVPPPPARRASLLVGVGVYEQASVLLSNEVLATNAFGVSGSVESTAAGRFGAWLTLDYRLPTQTRSQALGVELQGFEGRLVARAAAWSSRSWSVDFGFGPGLDVMYVTTVINRSGAVKLAPPTIDASFLIRSLVGVRWKSTLGLYLISDFDVTGRSYVFDLDGRSEVALDVTRARVAFLIEVALH